MQELEHGHVSARSTHSFAPIGGWVRFQALPTLRRVFGLGLATLGVNASYFRFAVESGFVLGLGYIWAQITWVWVAGVSIPPDDVFLDEGVVVTSVVQPAADLSSLTAGDPFTGRAFADESTLVERSDAPETNLDLSLFGIRAGTEQALGSAIIRTPDGKQSSFAVGESVVSGVRLERVLPDRVILSRAGLRESLFLVPQEKRTGLTIAGAQPATPANEQSAIATRSPISVLLSRITLRPRVQAGAINGFYVLDEKQSGILNGTQLQPGDVIMSVEGVRLVSAERIKDVVEELETATQVRVGIERDGLPNQFVLNLPVVQ